MTKNDGLNIPILRLIRLDLKDCLPTQIYLVVILYPNVQERCTYYKNWFLVLLHVRDNEYWL